MAGKGKDKPLDRKEGIKIIKDAGKKAWEKTHPPKDGSGDKKP